jgi:hypothetical protein
LNKPPWIENKKRRGKKETNNTRSSGAGPA